MTRSEEEALKVIQQKPEGVLQSDLWKILEVDSRKCSRIVKEALIGKDLHRSPALALPDRSSL